MREKKNKRRAKGEERKSASVRVRVRMRVRVRVRESVGVRVSVVEEAEKVSTGGTRKGRLAATRLRTFQPFSFRSVQQARFSWRTGACGPPSVDGGWMDGWMGGKGRSDRKPGAHLAK